MLRTVANVAVSGWTAAADHRPAGRPHRRPARAALPARPVQRGGRARARAPHQARGAARRRARRRGRAVHPVRRGPADRRRAPGGRVRRRRARLGRRRASSAAPRGATTLGRQRPWQRIGAAVAVLAVAGAGATVIGPHLPGADAHQRVVLYVEPPFDVSAYPSPLAGFRDYTKDVPAGLSVYGKELLATTGLPAGSRVRIAAMDAYDGLSWGVANAARGLVLRRLPAGRRAAARGGARPDPDGDDHDRARLRPAVAARPGRHDRVHVQRDRTARRPPPRSASTSPPPPASSPTGCPPACATRSAPRP